IDLFPSYQEGLRQLARSMGLPASPPRGGPTQGSLGRAATVGAAVAVLSLMITTSSNNSIRNPNSTAALAPAVTTSNQPSPAVVADQQLVAANFESVAKLHGDLL